jgi:hypothetical protein
MPSLPWRRWDYSREKIQARRVWMSEQTHILDLHGTPIAPLPITEIGDSDDDMEILREDLVGVLAGNLGRHCRP